MKSEQIPPQDDAAELRTPEQLETAKEAAVEARAIELRKVNNWTLPYARIMARQQLKGEEWKKQSGQEEKFH